MIPNGIGGRKVIYDFICNDCNRKTGNSWDAALCKQLAHLSLLFQIKRERNPPAKMVFNTVDGSKIRILPGGDMEHVKPNCEVIPTEQGIRVHIEARNKKEAKQKLKEVIESVSKKHPNVNVSDAKNFVFQEKTEYLDSPIVTGGSYGGIEETKSTVKTVLAMISDCGIDTSTCEHAINFLHDKSEPCVGFYYDEIDLVQNRPHGIPFHCVHVEGCPDSKLIKGYVEYFGHIRYVALLSSTYSGRPFSNTYSINPLDGSKLDLIVKVSLTEDDVIQAYKYNKYNQDVVLSATNAVLDTMMKRDFERQRAKAINQATEYAFTQMGLNGHTELNDTNREQFVGYIIEKMMPFFLNNLRKK